MKLNKEQVLALVRQLLTSIGVILVTNGILEEGILLEIVGSITTLVSVVWSMFDKTDAQLQKRIEEYIKNNPQ